MFLIFRCGLFLFRHFFLLLCDLNLSLFSLLILYLSFTFRFLPFCCPVWLVHLSAVPISVLHYADVSVSNVSVMLHRERLSTEDGTLYHIHPGQFVVLCTSGCHNLK